ncbi:MAG: hypothetical protein FWB73_02900 [Treponema sp.]|nr:hypothetical protein [Treponema sp.]
MRKALFVILVSTFIVLTCDNNDMKEENPYPDGVYPFEVSNVQYEWDYYVSITWDDPTDSGFKKVEYELFADNNPTGLTNDPPVLVYTSNSGVITPIYTSINPEKNKLSFRSVSSNTVIFNIKCVDKYGNKSEGKTYNFDYIY